MQAFWVLLRDEVLVDLLFGREFDLRRQGGATSGGERRLRVMRGHRSGMAGRGGGRGRSRREVLDGGPCGSSRRVVLVVAGGRGDVERIVVCRQGVARIAYLIEATALGPQSGTRAGGRHRVGEYRKGSGPMDRPGGPVQRNHSARTHNETVDPHDRSTDRSSSSRSRNCSSSSLHLRRRLSAAPS
jgi:hypothetical protein